MISGILITAKCHMHVSQSWEPLHRIENKHVKLLSGCHIKKKNVEMGEEKKNMRRQRVKSDVLLLN